MEGNATAGANGLVLALWDQATKGSPGLTRPDLPMNTTFESTAIRC